MTRRGSGALFAAVTLFASHADAWWDTGHSFITINTYQQLPAPLQPYFNENQTTITTNAKNEPPGLHFIDIDAYPEFHDDGTFPRDLNVLYAEYGTSLVNGRGISPWSILNYRQQLTSQMAAADTLAKWQSLAVTAGQMAHYIEDIHQPLHTTQNYDGQFTGNSGVHARYEGTMVNGHFDGLTIAYAPDKTVYIPDTVDTVLNSIDVTWRYVSQIMTADTAATSVDPARGTAYYDSMWASVGGFTHTQFQLASQMVASMWYSAWVDAGSPAPIVTEPKWLTDADGNWSDWYKWESRSPNAIDAHATFGNSITAPRTVTLDTPQTVGLLKFDSPQGYTLAGPGTLTIQTSTGNGSITFTSGSHVIAAPLHLSSNTDVTLPNAGDSLTLSGDMSANAGLKLRQFGPGVLKVKNLRVTTADIEGSKIVVMPNASPNDPGGVSRMSILTIAILNAQLNTTLDLTNNAMVYDYSTTSSISSIQSELRTGYHNGAWDGKGITSSTAAAISADSSNPSKTAIGFAEASTLGITSFHGQTVDTTTVLLAYTLRGDANLDGVVNALDFNALATNFSGATGRVWTQGDFNYDGKATTADFTLLAANFNRSLESPALGGLVPEPGSGWIFLFLALRLRRRIY